MGPIFGWPVEPAIPNLGRVYGAKLADVYDLLYRARKDYPGEVRQLTALIRDRVPGAVSLLDVACGTGEHLLHLREEFDVAGVDLSESMLAHARRKLPGVPLHRADMRSFDLGRRFDVVCCLFSSIGYAASITELRTALVRMAAHLAPGGLLIVEPWLFPDTWRDNQVSHDVVEGGPVVVARMSHSTRHGRTSRLEMHYLVGDGHGVRHFLDRQELSLFTRDEYADALDSAGCRAEWLPDGPSGRGLFVASRRATDRRFRPTR